MKKSDRLGFLLALPGMTLAAVIFSLLIYSTTTCDPFYEPNRLLDFSFLSEIKPGVARKLGGPIEPPPRPKLRLSRHLPFPNSCFETR